MEDLAAAAEWCATVTGFQLYQHLDTSAQAPASVDSYVCAVSPAQIVSLAPHAQLRFILNLEGKACWVRHARITPGSQWPHPRAERTRITLQVPAGTL
jgi:hypothetical protein